VIDPIDGATSYIHGYPFYSVSLALKEDGRALDPDFSFLNDL